MNVKAAKKLRKVIYGDKSLQARTYYLDNNGKTIHADLIRQAYQKAKKQYLNAKRGQ